jgi:hypothetical protein
MIISAPALGEEQPSEGVTRHGGIIYYGRYRPKVPKSLAEIPEPVRGGLSRHLRTRLGDDFYARLKFVGGQIVDIEELHRVDPTSKNFRWEVPGYRLHFEFQMPEAGIRSYTAAINLRTDGSVLEEIDLPAFASNPEKLRFVSLAKALASVSTKGFDSRKTIKEISYNRKEDILIWRFRQKTADDGLVMTFRNIEVNAHTGEASGIYESKPVR